MTNAKQFLQSIHGDNKIHFRLINDKINKVINLHDTYDNIKDQLQYYNDNGYNIYFTVNSGGTKQNEINKINAFFIDLDMGRDKNKNYYPIEMVQDYKNNYLKKIHSFNLEPTSIIETRNGLHFYWTLKDNITHEQFITIQLKLIDHFESDPAVKTVERIMRLPDYYWCKGNYDKFKCKLIELNSDYTYTIEQFENELKHILIDTDETKDIETRIKERIKDNTYTHKNNVEYIKNGLDNKSYINKLQQLILANRLKNDLLSYNSKLNCDGGFVSLDKYNINTIVSFNGHENPFEMKSVEFGSHQEIYDYLKKQDLREYLGIYDQYFHCIFHEDNNPSASIYQDQTTGYWWYKCFSSDCRLNKTIKLKDEKIQSDKKEYDIKSNMKAKDIIAITERLLKCNRVKALRFLRKVYNINFVETEWQKEQRDILDENIRMLTVNIEEFEKQYPNLYKRIKPSKQDLIELNIFAKEFVLTENYTDNENNAVFFASLQKLCSLFGLSPNSAKSIIRKFGVYAFLGLVNKLSEDNIPTPFLKTAQHYAIKNNQKNIVGFYSIPSYTDELLSQAEEMSVIFKEKNMTSKGLSREMLLRIFDKEVADRIFPQTTKRKISEKSQMKTDILHKIANELINQYGYTTEKEILDTYDIQHENDSNKITRTQMELQLKRSLQEMLDTYGWERKRLNNKLKQELNADHIEGYPFVIIK